MNQNKCFLDTNIWLYAFIKSQNDEKHHLAQAVLEENTPVISTQVINELCFNLIKKAQYPENDIQELIASIYDHYSIILIDRNTLLRASELREQYAFSFWDSLIVSCAIESHSSILYSEDMHDNLIVNNKLTIINPFKPG